MSGGAARTADDERAEALRLMERAMELLDRSDLAFNVVPHLDLAICRLRTSLDSDTRSEDGFTDLSGS